MYQVQILALDYDIDLSELDITYHYSSSRVPGGSYAAYNIEPSVDAIVALFGQREKGHLVTKKRKWLIVTLGAK